MWYCFLCLGKRPVRLRPCLPGEDVQGALPVGWCVCCGSEVFRPGDALCCRCKGIKGKGEPVYDGL